jgi:hypothetical protein
MVLWLLLFADDLALTSRTAEGLQAQLGVLGHFASDSIVLVVNTVKTNLVVFRSDRSPIGFHWMFRGASLPVVTSFKYLGITFCEKRGFWKAGDAPTDSARRAGFAMRPAAMH